MSDRRRRRRRLRQGALQRKMRHSSRIRFDIDARGNSNEIYEMTLSNEMWINGLLGAARRTALIEVD